MIELTSCLDVHDVTDEGGDPVGPGLPQGLAHHSLQLFSEQLNTKSGSLNQSIINKKTIIVKGKNRHPVVSYWEQGCKGPYRYHFKLIRITLFSIVETLRFIISICYDAEPMFQL